MLCPGAVGAIASFFLNETARNEAIRSRFLVTDERKKATVRLAYIKILVGSENPGPLFRSCDMKRMFDLMFSVIALFTFAFPAIAISLLLLLKERHSILYKQVRIGKSKRPFQILKFQTMIDGVPTRTGQLLRQTGLDELPQFINVLKGEMSIVGPRALTAYDIERLGWDDEVHEIRWKLNPGITGFAQIYGGQHRKTSWFWDKYYIAHNSVPIDACIVGVSFLMNIFGKAKVRRLVFRRDLK